MRVKGMAKLLAAVTAITCISFPSVSHAEETATNAVKTNFAIPQDIWDGNADLRLQALYLGTDTGGGGAEYGQNLLYTNRLSDGGYYYNMNLDDNTLTDEQMRTDKGVNQNPSAPKAPKAEDYENGEQNEEYISAKAEYDALKAVYDASSKMIEPNTGWGFHGMKVLKYNSETGEHFGAVQNMANYTENGAAVYKIKIDEEATSEGAVDDAYLTVGYYANINDTNKGQTHNYDEKMKEFDETVDDDKNAGMWTLRVAGVKLSDYYNASNDIDEFGYHTVIVPLSEFETGNADFKKLFRATKAPNAYDDSSDFNPGMIKMVGVARADSKSAKTFKFSSRGYGLVAPSAPTEFTAVKSNGGVVFEWNNTTDMDVEYEVIKEINGQKNVFGKSDEGTFTEENFDPSTVGDEVKYYVVAKDTEFGVESASNAVVFNETVKTSSVAKEFLTSRTGWWDGTQIPTTGGAYYVGTADDWGGYYAYNSADFKTENGKKLYRANINDSNAEKNAINANAGWGFSGLITNWSAGDGEKYNIALPSYGNVVNIKENDSNAYAVFSVKLEAGNTEGAYLAIAYFNSAADTSYNNKYTNPEDIKEFDSVAAGEAAISRLRMAGVPLADYYDNSTVTENGYHLIAVPIKEFIENDEFGKVYVKSTNSFFPTRDAEYTSGAVLNTGMIKGMGIARIDGKDSGNFTYSADKMTIYTPHCAERFTGSVEDDGKVTLSWRPSTDTDVVKYQLKKDVEGTVTYTDVTSGANAYTDTVDLSSNNQVKYSIVTTGADGICAETQKFIVNERVERSEVLYDMEVGAQSQNGDTAEPHSGAMFNWYTGVLEEEYGQYSDWYGIDSQREDYRRVMRGWINDSNYVWDSSASSSKQGNIVSDREYGYVGYKFNSVAAGGPGAVVDLSKNTDGYAVFEVNFEKDGSVQDLTDVYFTLNYGMKWADVFGYENGMTYGDAGLGKINHAAVVGVKASDYYDITKGGYQTIMIPLSAFTNEENPAMKDIITPADIETDVHYDKYLAEAKAADFAEHTDLFSGLAVARKNSNSGNFFEVKIKELYILSTPAPVFVKAERISDGVEISWKQAGLIGGVSKYEVYRDGTKIATAENTLSYTDTAALTSGEHIYGVKAVSPKYTGHISSAATAKVEIPHTEEIKFFTGTGANRTETKYAVSGTIEVDVMAVASGTQGYAAVFGSDGTLKAVKTAALGSETAKTLTFENILESDTVKAFIWNSKNVPICDEEKIESRGTRVLVIGDAAAVDSVDYLDDIAKADGGKTVIEVIYTDNAVMSDHYENITKDKAVYKMAINGVDKNENVSFGDLDGDYDYVVLQDKAVYVGLDEYYAEGGKGDTQIPQIVSAIKAKSANAEIIANGSAGFTEAYYNSADSELKDYMSEQGYTEFSYAFSCTMLVTGAFAEKADKIIDNNMTATYYDETGAKVFVENGYNLSANGKFLVAVNLYKAMTGKTAEASFAPSDVTDAAEIIEIVNTQE